MADLPFTLDQLRILRAIVSEGSFKKAADSLYVTQPAVSLQIQNLEKQLEEKLNDPRIQKGLGRIAQKVKFEFALTRNMKRDLQNQPLEVIEREIRKVKAKLDPLLKRINRQLREGRTGGAKAATPVLTTLFDRLSMLKGLKFDRKIEARKQK